jgi:putative DNA primase/helicase
VGVHRCLDEAVIAFVKRAVGYSLSGYNDEQCLLALVGSGANGKSTLLNVLQHVLGDYAATTPAQTLMASRHGNEQTNDLAKLVGIRFVTATETEKGQRLAESKIKRITGGDRIVCRELYGKLFEYDPQFKIWLATNDLPQFAGGDKSIARRIWVIEFPVTFEEGQRDSSLQDRLLSETSGILNWMLEGYGEWKRQGLNPPKAVRIVTNNYRIENDTVGQFIEARCSLDPTLHTDCAKPVRRVSLSLEQVTVRSWRSLAIKLRRKWTVTPRVRARESLQQALWRNGNAGRTNDCPTPASASVPLFLCA